MLASVKVSAASLLSTIQAQAVELDAIAAEDFGSALCELERAAKDAGDRLQHAADAARSTLTHLHERLAGIIAGLTGGATLAIAGQPQQASPLAPVAPVAPIAGDKPAEQQAQTAQDDARTNGRADTHREPPTPAIDHHDTGDTQPATPAPAAPQQADQVHGQTATSDTPPLPQPTPTPETVKAVAAELHAWNTLEGVTVTERVVTSIPASTITQADTPAISQPVGLAEPFAAASVPHGEGDEQVTSPAPESTEQQADQVLEQVVTVSACSPVQTTASGEKSSASALSPVTASPFPAPEPPFASAPSAVPASADADETPRDRARRMLAEYPEMSNRQIGEACGLSKDVVWRLSQAMKAGQASGGTDGSAA